MKFTLSWLKTHLDTDATLDQITATLTRIGLELEDVEDRGAALAPFRIARVIEAMPHPNADRLRVCTVDTGTETVRVVCGAPNARTGMKGVFAPPGTFIPGTGITLKIGDPCVSVEKPSADSSRSAVLVHLKSGAVVAADRLLVATGRRPNVEAWRAAGLAQTERGWLKVDPATLEARDGVFGAGDVTGLGGFTHLAYYHGQVIARRLRGPGAKAHGSSADNPQPAQWAQPALAARPPDIDRAAADQRAGRHAQLLHHPPRPTAACVRRGKAYRRRADAASRPRRDVPRA
jgi:hypothetical protein